MAGGVGNRLLPHTETMPKCLLKVRDHTILEYQLAALEVCGIEDVIIVTGHASKEIQKRIGGNVTYIKNKDFATTNSAYGLWITRDLIKDGFIYLNADLLLHPKLLQALLDAPEEDAIIIDRKVNIKGDMKKVQMEGSRIIHMSKDMSAGLACGEAVGPVKFSKAGARNVIEKVTEFVEKGELNQWAYEAFNQLAKRQPFYGIENPGIFWAEIDTRADLEHANRSIPDDFPTPSPTGYIEDADVRPKGVAINEDPFSYLDQLTGSKFKPILESIPHAPEVVESSLKMNEAQFKKRTALLKDGTSAASLYTKVQKLIVAMEKDLYAYFGQKNIHVFEDLQQVIQKTFELIPTELKRNWYLKEEKAREILGKHPPVTMLKHSPASDLDSLFEKHSPLEVLAMTRFTETEVWQAKYHQLLSKIKPVDFEERDIEPLCIHISDYKGAIQESKQSLKPWRGGHNKETGKLLCISIEDPGLFKTPLLLYILVFLHYFYETMYPSHFYRKVAEENPEEFGEAVVNSFLRQKEHFPAFALNIFSENLFWKKALELFYVKFPSKESTFFHDTIHLGEYVQSNGKPILFSLNIVDQVWDANFSGKNSPDAKLFETSLFSYHLRQELWHHIVHKLTKLSEQELDETIVANLGDSDIALAKKLFKDL